MSKLTYRKGSVSWLLVQGNRSFTVGQARQKGLEAPDSMTAQEAAMHACMPCHCLLPFPTCIVQDPCGGNGATYSREGFPAQVTYNHAQRSVSEVILDSV